MGIKELHQLFMKSKGISTDTRSIKNGQLFFALKGDNFNGNIYAEKALEKGGLKVIVDDKKYFKADNIKYIFVDDALICLQQLAHFHRKYLAIPIIAITGTNGKTTTKELIYNVIQQKFQTVATKGNLNNHIGVPLTLLSMDKNTEIGIVEMGANHINEIKNLCKIAEPDYGIITNIGTAHIEGFGSTKGVIQTKKELYDYLKQKNAVIFINSDDKVLKDISKGIQKISYGILKDYFCFGKYLDSNPFLKLEWKKRKIQTNLVGQYNFNNVLAALAVGTYFKIGSNNIISAIEEYKPSNNRSQYLETQNNRLIIDAYNANPSSMSLALQNFDKIEAKDKWIILGDMLELGFASLMEHKKILDMVSKMQFEKAIIIGNEFAKNKANHKNFIFYEKLENFLDFLKENKLKDKYILLKGSRGIQLEKLISYL